jgi:hypothetical protein
MAASASRDSVAPASSQNRANDLPIYKKPSYPLDAEATRKLRELQGRNLHEVKKHNKQALETITATAESVNDMLREHSDYIARRQKKWDTGKGLNDRAQEERDMEKLQGRVDDYTVKLEESMRAVIDSNMATQRIDETLDWLRQNAPKQLEDEYNTQMTQRNTQRQSQINSQRRRAQDPDGDDGSAAEELEDGPTPGPTPLDGTRITLTGVSEQFKLKQQEKKDAYTSLSYTARYARNNEYRDFKRIVHDAKYGDEGPPLGHEDTWFSEAGLPEFGITNTQRGTFDDDDDIVMDRATISTRCPLTFQQFKEPFTSTKCPHTFEKNAILEYIRRAPGRMPHCPVTGCDQVSSLPHVCLESDSDCAPVTAYTCASRILLPTIFAPTPSLFERSSACNKPRPQKPRRAQTKKLMSLLVKDRDISMVAMMHAHHRRDCRFLRRNHLTNPALSKTWATRAKTNRCHNNRRWARWWRIWVIRVIARRSCSNSNPLIGACTFRLSNKHTRHPRKSSGYVSISPKQSPLSRIERWEPHLHATVRPRMCSDQDFLNTAVSNDLSFWTL